MNKTNLLIWGTGGHARVVRDQVATTLYSQIIMLDDSSEKYIDDTWHQLYPPVGNKY